MLDEIILPKINTSINSEEIRNNVIFMANLTNEVSAYSKYDTGLDWLQLKEYLRVNPDIWIKSFYLRFRDHYEHIATDKDGYFLHLGAQCYYGSPTQNLMIAGYVENGLIKRRRFIVPELVEAVNSPDEFSVYDENMQKGLIWKENMKANTELKD
jgi:hypothetical protein